MIELRGKAVADALKEKMKTFLDQVDELNRPKLAIVRVGERPDDLAYERMVLKNCGAIGLPVQVEAMSEAVATEELIAAIQKLNDDVTVQGILMFRPLPKHIDEQSVIEAVAVEKDVDCMNPKNLQLRMVSDESAIAPCTPEAVMRILEHYGYELEGKNVAIVNRSTVIGRPLAIMMMEKNATVTICHSRTKNLAEVTSKADIVVTGVGRARFFGPEYFNENSVVIDIGINFDEKGSCGDVDYEAVAPKVAAITPVPGGVGTVTSSVLLSHVLPQAFY
ncbi:MAG: bifunctional 5,10-methylenetetrahydrofolate dehydrogenase/5,10-methenyltetrahydrofolate cyclohydrolase [Firmicutes bacterium]|nr:bifunctional 5,10-methylenetetrahydrofolate dehydrogenase/5,10-methenyltetrahydrofolate cyclohydrolase [Bacillota bacterium]MBQ2270667.1 bifunctional 5,10-methylenetetrahydrofolate dehydrogenase/5,10-methenyltetrahydrofolate cyclohydrolase [Bacillota bacterium]